MRISIISRILRINRYRRNGQAASIWFWPSRCHVEIGQDAPPPPHALSIPSPLITSAFQHFSACPAFQSSCGDNPSLNFKIELLPQVSIPPPSPQPEYPTTRSGICLYKSQQIYIPIPSNAFLPRMGLRLKARHKHTRSQRQCVLETSPTTPSISPLRTINTTSPTTQTTR